MCALPMACDTLQRSSLAGGGHEEVTARKKDEESMQGPPGKYVGDQQVAQMC